MPNIAEQNNGNISPKLHDDEIDLFELVEGLWQQKWLVAAITTASAVVALVAVLVMQPTYQAEAFLRAPLTSQLALIQDSKVLSIDPETALERIAEELNSVSLRREVYDSNLSALFEEPLVEAEALDFNFTYVFLPSLAVITPSKGAKKDDLGRRVISFDHFDPHVSASIPNQLVSMAALQAKANLLEEFRSTLAAKLNRLRTELELKSGNLVQADQDKIAQLTEKDRLERLQVEDEIAALRRKAANLRQDEVVRLEEALKVARSLNIAEPTTLTVMARELSVSPSSMSITNDISEEKDPDYLRGTRVLTAELAALKARASDDAHIPELRELQMRLDLLSENRQIEILNSREDYAAFVTGADALREEISKLEDLFQNDFEELSLLRIDQPALTPSRPIKPRKALILAAAIVAGGMFGVLIALIRNAAAARRELAVKEQPLI
ncbi:MAG: Wzz/FepE/Etk N-terminal domain-containing protein [Halioglobus sp.]